MADPAETAGLTEDEKLIRQALDHFKEADEADTQRDLRKADLKFALGDSDNEWQWPDSILQSRKNSPGGARPILTINKIPQHIRQVTNEQRQNKPSIKVRPTNDEADSETADVFNGIIRHVEDSSDAQTAYMTAGEHQVISGLGYWRITTEWEDESFDKEIKIVRVKNPYTVYMDPFIQTPEGSDARYAFIVREVPTEVFERDYPDAVVSNWQEDDTGWFSEESVRVAEYFYIEYKERTLVKMMTGQTCYLDTLPKDTPIFGFVHKDGKRLERKVQEPHVKWCKLTAAEPLEKRDFPCKWIPVVRLVGEEWEVDDKLVIKGLTRNAKDPQRMVNYWRTGDAEYVNSQTKAPYLADPRQIEGYEEIWQSANIENRPYLPYNAIIDGGIVLPFPQRQQPPQSSTGFMQGSMTASDDLQAVMGQYNASIGKTKNDQSGKALQQLRLEGDTGTYHYLDNLAKAVRQTGRILIDMIPQIYDAKKVARILGEDGQDSFAVLDSEQPEAVKSVEQEDGSIKKIFNLTVGKYDVAVTVGPSYTTKRQESQAFYTELATAYPPLLEKAGDLVIRTFDQPGADKVADRLKKFLPPNVLEGEGDDEQDPKIKAQQLTAMVGQLEQGLQQAGQLYEQAQEHLKQAAEQIAKAELDAKNKQLDFDAKMAQIQAGSESDQLKAATQIAVAEIGAESSRVSAELKANLDAFMARLTAFQGIATAQYAAEGQESSARATGDAQIESARLSSEGQVGAAAHSAQGQVGAAEQAAKAKAAPIKGERR